MNELFFTSEWIGRFTDNELDQNRRSMFSLWLRKSFAENELRMDREINDMLLD